MNDLRIGFLVAGCTGALLLGCGSGDSTAKGTGPSASAAVTTARPSSAAPSAKPSASAPVASASASAAAEPPPPPPPYDGKLTIAMVMGADNVANPFDAWDDAMKLLEKHVGKPTHVDKSNYCWAAVEADKCAYFCIEKTDFTKLRREGKTGPAVGSTDHPQTVDKSADIAFEMCAKHAPGAKKK